MTKNNDNPKANPQVRLQTSFGEIVVELYAKEAPISTANFLGYVNSKFYDGTIFHRVIPGFMIQCGGMDKNMNEKPNKQAPIKNEADNGLKNVRGTLAMARTQEVDSATSQFFINLRDNAFLDHGYRDFGYAVFGKVVSGMEVVDKIAEVKTGRNGFHEDVPLSPITIDSATVK
ncbi:MAG: peptidylprolyl isomerase [Planctomycetes bacterium]|nr:peptidylprolyl isomerase [Planctomycetota bacterium]